MSRAREDPAPKFMTLGIESEQDGRFSPAPSKAGKPGDHETVPPGVHGQRGSGPGPGQWPAPERPEAGIDCRENDSLGFAGSGLPPIAHQQGPPDGRYASPELLGLAGFGDGKSNRRQDFSGLLLRGRLPAR